MHIPGSTIRVPEHLAGLTFNPRGHLRVLSFKRLKQSGCQFSFRLAFLGHDRQFVNVENQ